MKHSERVDEMKKVCVFGGGGFLGSHVADYLCDSGHKVRIFDLTPSAWLRDEQEMVVGDILNYPQVRDAVKDCEVVYNFAALSDLNQGLRNPIDSIRTNILGNGHIMEACVHHGVERFMYASTVYVNGRQGGFYRCSKQAAESYIEEYHRIYSLQYTILRYGSLYGPRSGEDNGLYRIVKGAVDSGVAKYAGSLEALREYIHVIDAARASVAVMDNDFRNQSIVLTGPQTMRVHDVLEMLSEILNLKLPAEYKNIEQPGHYVRTPYAYEQRLGMKYVLPMHVDFGQGLMQLIEEVKSKQK